MNSEVFVNTVDERALVKIKGKPSAYISKDIILFVKKHLRLGVKDIIIDLSNCQKIGDSFTASLCFISFKAKKRDVIIKINGCNDGIIKTMNTLGLGNFFEFTYFKFKDVDWQKLDMVENKKDVNSAQNFLRKFED
jgi:anti-anti-sigma regulatory factor